MTSEMTILIVDDDPAMTKMLKAHISETQPCQAVCFNSPSEGLSWVEQHEPDLVLVDYMMPEMDGIEFISRFREMKDREDVPVVMITAIGEKKLRNQALLLGASDFLTKPFDGDELSSRVKNLLALRQARKKLAEDNRYLQDIVTQEVALNIEKDRALMRQSQMAVLGQLAASITHEINTPLTYIKGNLELLKSECEKLRLKNKGQFSELITSMEDGIRRIGDTVGSMREIGRYSTREKISADIMDTVLCAARIVHSRAKHIAGIYLNNRRLDKNPTGNGKKYNSVIDVQSIEQLWIILINNSLDALQYTNVPFEERFVKVDVSREGQRIKVIVRDNGGGIPSDIVDIIFEPFKGAKPQGGMGLGLHIANTIVENHTGKIKAHNDGVGAVFEVVL